jgi:glycolate oxidase FAD binding subunit
MAAPLSATGDMTGTLREAIREAAAARRPLVLAGGNSKRFLGRIEPAVVVEVSTHRGIVNYQPDELVLTARAGTPLAEIEETLAARRQMLAFEPPHYGPAATLGGTVAAGLSGPRRPWVGCARDFVLGVRIVNGSGAVLRFGGEVMKNVAGYDLSRVMAGAMGTLGLLLEVSLKVLPRPQCEATLRIAMPAGEALRRMSVWAGRPWPLSGACHDGEALVIRLAGREAAVAAAMRQLPAGEREDGGTFWAAVREQTLPHFRTGQPLWRVSVPPATPPLEIGGPCLIDWGGGLRWHVSADPPASVRAVAARAGGHATWFRNRDAQTPAFHPVSEPLMRLHRRLKAALDPFGILNPGRLYPDL